MSEDRTARLKAIRTLEKDGTDAYLPAHAWGLDLTALDRRNLTKGSITTYRAALRKLLNAGLDPFDPRTLQAYVDGLKAGRRKTLLSALRLTVIEPEPAAENVPAVHRLLAQFASRPRTAKKKAPAKTIPRIWLSSQQVQEMLQLCGDSVPFGGDLEGRRDSILLELALRAGLGCEELVALTFAALQRGPNESGEMRDILQVPGKGARHRIIPIDRALAGKLREWHAIVGDGRVARSLGMKKELGHSLTRVAVYQIVRKYGQRLGLPKLSPEDLRRTYARLAYEAGTPLTELKELLGHDKVTTTIRFLGLPISKDDLA